MKATTMSKMAVLACQASVAAWLLLPSQLAAQTSAGPGCDASRPAVAHASDGAKTSMRGAPIPCLTNTGLRTLEDALVVTNKGVVMLAPVPPGDGKPTGIARSKNQGATWELINPGGNPPRRGAGDMTLAHDKVTDRVFLSSEIGAPARVDYSDDGGDSWQQSSQIFVQNDHTLIFFGPPTEALKPKMNYPVVVYYVVAGGYGTCPRGGFCGTHIAKSLDGGRTFGTGSVMVPFPDECPFPANFPVGQYGLEGTVTADGTIYLPITPCQKPYVAVSKDAGDSWELRKAVDREIVGWGEFPIAADAQGNLHGAYTDRADGLLYLIHSVDGGKSWSVPLVASAPKVNETSMPRLAVGNRGKVVMSYFGSTNGPRPFAPPCIDGGLSNYTAQFPLGQTNSPTSCSDRLQQTWNMYVTETANPLEPQPRFWSATLNRPSQPVLYGANPAGMRYPGPDGSPRFSIGTSGGFHTDYFGMEIGPDGTAWVGFMQQCPPGVSDGNPNCKKRPGQTAADPQIGMVGRLLHMAR